MNKSSFPAKIVILMLCGLIFLALSFTASGSSVETEPILIPLMNIGDLLKCKSFPPYGEVVELAFSPDGKFLALGLGYKNGAIYLWNLESGQISALTSINYISAPSFCFSPDGKTLASIIDSEHLVLYDVLTGSGKALYHAPDYRWWLYSVAFSPDGKTIASVGNSKNIDLWDARSGKKIKTLKHKFDFLSNIRFSPDGNILAAVIGYDKKVEDNSIGFWDLKTGKMVSFLKGHAKGVRSIAFSPDFRILASGSADKSIIIWDVATGNKIKHIQGLDNEVLDLALSPNGKILAAALGRPVMFLDLETGERLEIKEQNCNAVAFSPDGSFLAIGGNRWEVDTTQKENTKKWIESASLWDLSFFGVKRKFKKDAFETTQEYGDRVSRIEIPFSMPVALRKEQYNADRGGFTFEFKDNKLFIPVEREKAKELAGRKPSEVKLAGKLKYYDPENLALVEGRIVDAVTQEEYAVCKLKE
ncbi:MAG: WD40 repeat domain-containing protein [Bacillota bacterium]